ncbi:MAG: 3-deoxy-7-phosphoheptulonate synthase [Gammaproteobacteria bacterium]|nr:3-deoxy-7-phosphoheptulonate synthase [Gammaproteobacteria bacterium]
MKARLNNVNVFEEQVLSTPVMLKQELPLSDEGRENVLNYREQLGDIMEGKDKRLLIVSGPCSIHDIDSAKAYAEKLKVLHDKYADKFFIVMRVYFEKPRTTVGWKGLINDPNLNDTFDVESGLRKARELLIWIAELGLPAGTEMLDPITPQYLAELFCWSAIGARTTESQTHREMASGLSMPVGFKNGTDGNIEVAINALNSASSQHNFLGINTQGRVALIKTKGNPHGHIILRGGKTPNYDSVQIAMLEERFNDKNMPTRFVVDCSHGNSEKDFQRQPLVFRNVIEQIRHGNTSITGMMLESHLNEGNQKISSNLSQLDYGVSVTDACINWQTTEDLIEESYKILKTPSND